jgi:hypothetical protein
MPFRGKKEKSSMPLFAQPKKRHAAWAQALYCGQIRTCD